MVQKWSTKITQDLKTAGIENLNISPTSLIWGILLTLFLVMSIREFLKSKRGLHVDHINLGFSDLNKAYETTRKAIIEADKSSHRIAAVSYMLAGLTALVSFTISLL